MKPILLPLTLTWALALATAGCAAVPPSYDSLRGDWGGRHIGLHIGETDSAVEFDCAEGRIFPPYTIASGGRFEWSGTFTRGTGGPVRVGFEPPSIAATYSGTVRGGHMSVTIRLDDRTSLGRYELDRFAQPQLLRCL